MTDIHIPPQAVEAARLAVAKALIEGEDGLTAAIRAALENWPGMRLGKYRDVAGPNDRIILPLNTEPRDA